MKIDQPLILTINGGSSSIKFSLYKSDQLLVKVLDGKIEGIGQDKAAFHVKTSNPSESFSHSINAPDHKQAIKILLDWVKASKYQSLTAIGHRIVHGGPKYYKPQKINAEIIEELHRLSPFDPEHLPAELLLIETLAQQFPTLPQVACFDTAFHFNMPRVAKILPIPRCYESKGICRYGFHGLSYEFLMDELTRIEALKAKQDRIILIHLGNGASLAAVREGKSIDTSMSFTPSAGVLMSTRSGDLDPGLFLYLAQTEGLDAKQFNEMVNKQSGLLGISETSSDMRNLLNHEKEDIRAAEAIQLFCYQIKKWIGAYAAALGGLDSLVFAGGIGENAPLIRSRICSGLEFLGIELQNEQNILNSPVISTDSSRIIVRVIHTDEEVIIAKHVYEVLYVN
ncbi:MAG: acetate/propionate family kinase [Parachlamydiaceae bacterium]|nr:acetate/propionate family kinase [Parachlamydiaceae bacterium]